MTTLFDIATTEMSNKMSQEINGYEADYDYDASRPIIVIITDTKEIPDNYRVVIWKSGAGYWKNGVNPSESWLTKSDAVTAAVYFLQSAIHYERHNLAMELGDDVEEA